MPITTKQDIFNETRFIFVTDITTSDLLALECLWLWLGISRRCWEWSSLSPSPPHVTPILGRNGHFLTPLSFPTWDSAVQRTKLLWFRHETRFVIDCVKTADTSESGQCLYERKAIMRHIMSVHDVVLVPVSATRHQPPPHYLTPRLSKWHNSQDVLPSLTGLSCSLVATSSLNLQNIPSLNTFEGRLAIIVVWQQNIFSLLNGCFCGYWCVFSGMIGSSWTGNWERAADGVPCVPHHYPIIVTKLACKFP